MHILNLIMDILIGLAFLIKVCFKGFIKVYAYRILPYILLVSVLNIYTRIKNKDYKSYRIFYSIFWILMIFILIFTS